MKLIIQIPCFNEEATLPSTLRDLPKSIPGIDDIETLVIDDGSSDGTADLARELGVSHVVRLTKNMGLARAFATGLDTAVRLGADVVVNTDADNQYRGSEIPRLLEPILRKKADVVIGTRDLSAIGHFSPLKRFLQRLGSGFVRRISGTDIPDTTSGFRAYSRAAAMQINVLSDFTYTLETIIQAGTSGLAITHIPVETNPKLRESRLFTSTGEYIARSVITLVRIYTMYKPLRVFTTLAGILLVAGGGLVARFLYYYFTLEHVQTGHIQSLIVAAILLVVGFQVLLFGLIADLTAKNRKLVEDALVRLKMLEQPPTPSQQNRFGADRKA